MNLELNSPVRYLPRVGPILAGKLDHLGISTIEDLLWHIPFRYNDFTLVQPIASVRPGNTVTVSATVDSIRNAFTKNGKKLQLMKISDTTGALEVVWFNQTYLTKVINTGDRINLAGEISWFGRKIVMLSPEFELINPQLHSVSLHTGRLVPVYPETAGISSKWLRSRIDFILRNFRDRLIEYLPQEILAKEELLSLGEALREIHFPSNHIQSEKARTRLAFEEMFCLILQAKLQKYAWQQKQKSPALNISKDNLALFKQKLPFTLTNDQGMAIEEIFTDLIKPIPMNRILVGDVGSGKTIVAGAAIHAVSQNKLKSILMAPTQILANQHFTTLNQFLRPYKIQVELITGGVSHKSTKVDSADVLVGTHALLDRNILFQNVGLIVIDEQQRFGVTQRQMLEKKSKQKLVPHFLTMTATPIPRTMAKTLYGNLDVSVLNQMPKGRKLIKTWVIPPVKRDSAYTWIQKQIADHTSQAFIVCPLIDESESLTSVRAASSEFRRLARDIFPKLSLGLLHGRMKSKDKDKVLSQFRAGQLQILITTPVVEVGIDIPNATIMLIEGADRFGLAQLHQLRGRVGRGGKDSYCLLFSETTQDQVMARLKALEQITSGPELAEIDLKQRGPGELFGLRQHGVLPVKVAKFSDTDLIVKTQRYAQELVDHDPMLSQFPLLRTRLFKGKIEQTQD